MGIVRVTSTTGDVGWSAFAVIAGLLTALTAVGAVGAVFAGHWGIVAIAPLQLLAGYWFMAGAWRRTSWGLLDADHTPPDEPTLTSDRARLYITIAAAAVAATGVAVLIQLITAEG